MKAFILIILYFFISLSHAGGTNLVVNDIRVGSKGKKTRVVLVLSHPSELYIQEDEDHGLIKVQGPEDTLWQIPIQSQQSSGSFESYNIITNESGTGVCVMMVKPFTKIVSKGIDPNTKEYFIDLLEDKPEPPAPLPPPPVVVEPNIAIKQIIEPEIVKNIIQNVTIRSRGAKEAWLCIKSTQQAYFDYQNLSQDHTLLIYIPKTNWDKAIINNQSSPFINNVVVNEDSPAQSTLMLYYPGCRDVIDQFISPNNDGTFDFILVLADRKASPIEVQRLIEKQAEYKKQEQERAPKVINTTVESSQVEMRSNLGGPNEDEPVKLSKVKEDMPLDIPPPMEEEPEMPAPPKVYSIEEAIKGPLFEGPTASPKVEVKDELEGDVLPTPTWTSEARTLS